MFHSYPENMDSTLGHLRRATVLQTDDSGTQQILKKLRGLASERPENVYRPQPHGLSSVPPEGAEGLLLSLGGRGDRMLALGFEHKDYRPRNLPAGNATLYDDKGNVIWTKGGGGIAVAAKSGVVEVSSKDNKVFVKPAEGQMVYLGGDGTDGVYDFVMTESGPSINVKARIA
jgi:phage gp45-like